MGPNYRKIKLFMPTCKTEIILQWIRYVLRLHGFLQIPKTFLIKCCQCTTKLKTKQISDLLCLTQQPHNTHYDTMTTLFNRLVKITRFLRPINRLIRLAWEASPEASPLPVAATRQLTTCTAVGVVWVNITSARNTKLSQSRHDTLFVTGRQRRHPCTSVCKLRMTTRAGRPLVVLTTIHSCFTL